MERKLNDLVKENEMNKGGKLRENVISIVMIRIKFSSNWHDEIIS